MSDENSTIRIVDVGRAIPLVKGAWHAETAYEMLDIVSYTGYTYIARTNVEAGILPTDTEHWMLVAGSITNWGDIYGQIENQGDLRDALDAKLNAADAGTMAAVDDAPNNGSPYLRKGEKWYNADDRYFTKTEVTTKLNAKANLASPTFTGTPKAPTAAAGTNTTQLATTAFVQTGLSGKSDTGHTHDDRYYTETEMDTKLAAKADLASPTFTGTPKAPTAAKGTNTTQLATTAFVAAGLADKQNNLTFDSTPTASSTNPVTSGGVKTALDLKAPLASPTLTGTPAAPTAAKGTNTTQLATTAFVQTGLADKQNTLTFDNVPTAGSANPVKSGGIKTALDEKSGHVSATVSGSIVTFDDGVDAPIADMTVAIEPVQAGTGDPSPDNVRPISGFSACNVMRTRKNLLHEEDVRTVANEITWTKQPDGTIVANGTTTRQNQYQIFFSGLHGKFYFTGCPANATSDYKWDVYAWNWNKNERLKKWDQTTDCESDYGAFTLQEIYIPEGCTGQICLRIPTNTTVNNLVFKPMIVSADETDSTYEPFGTVYNVSFDSAGTVYGGLFDVSTGKLIVDKVKISITGTENFFKNTENQFYFPFQSGNTFLPPKINIPKSPTNISDAISNWYTVSSQANCTVGSNHIAFSAWDTRTFAYFAAQSADQTVDQFKQILQTAYAGGSPLELCYELETPLTYQLAPQQVMTILGKNNIWADTGDSTVTYFTAAGQSIGTAITGPKATADYLDTKTRSMITSNIEATTTASKSYSAGNLIILDGQLLRATTGIGIGGTITIGSNAETVTLETLLSELSA